MPKPYTPNDTWSRKAQEEGYRARSVYKLMELDVRFHLLSPGKRVLDMGAAPGSWLQYVSERIGPKGIVLGIDLTPIERVASNVRTATLDFTDDRAVETFLAESKVERVDLILSDAAPSTSGVKDVDQWQSLELCRAVLHVAEKYLAPGGRVALKVFRGADFDEFLREVKAEWPSVRVAHVKASRDRSREVYMVLSGRRA
ncbi:MAG: RlmE family RNA methyltransferase [Candidatus Peregrinibacteria bacterium]|nr:RlmE family RNA methyltransferase [Candidatus Peregrinibacteria bacterium]